MIYFDNGATTFPKPPCVYKAVAETMLKYGASPGRGGYDLAIKSGEILFEARETVGDFFGLKTYENVIFTTNATNAINLALKGILKKGDHFITSSFEHNAVARPAYKLSTQGIEWDIAKIYPNDMEKTKNSFMQKIKKNTKLVECIHASNVFGNIIAIEEIAKICKNRGILFMVDASQSAGVIPIDMEKMGIDILCTAGHKGLYGPSGTGLLLFKEGIEFDTIIEGGTGSYSKHLEQTPFFPDRLESGTHNTPAISGLMSGVKYLKDSPMEKNYNYEISLRNQLLKELKKNDNIIVYNLCRNNTPLLSFNSKTKDCEWVSAYLNENDIAVRSGIHCSPLAHKSVGTFDIGTVRVSFSVHNNEKEVSKFVECIYKM